MENLDCHSRSTNDKSIDQLVGNAANQGGDTPAVADRTSMGSADANHVDEIDKFGGYAFHFVQDPLPDELSNLLCKICHLPSKDPHQSECCGHTFCKSCAYNSKKSAACSNACPICRQSEFMLFPNKQIDRRVKKLHVYCINENDGCQWKGEISNTARQDLDKHRETCQFEMIKCEYHDLGCKGKIARKDIGDHGRENVREHLHMLRRKLARTKNELERVQKNSAVLKKKLLGMQKKTEELINDAKAAQGQENIKRLEIQLYNSLCQLHKGYNAWTLKLNALAAMSTSGEQVVPVVLKLTNFSKMKRDEWWYSDYFYSLNKESKMYLSVSIHAGDRPSRKYTCTYLSVQLSTVCSTSGLPLKWNIKLLNQISDQGQHYSVTVDTNTGEWKITHFISHSDLSNFLRNDCLFFEVKAV